MVTQDISGLVGRMALMAATGQAQFATSVLTRAGGSLQGALTILRTGDTIYREGPLTEGRLSNVVEGLGAKDQAALRTISESLKEAISPEYFIPAGTYVTDITEDNGIYEHEIEEPLKATHLLYNFEYLEVANLAGLPMPKVTTAEGDYRLCSVPFHVAIAFIEAVNLLTGNGWSLPETKEDADVVKGVRIYKGVSLYVSLDRKQSESGLPPRQFIERFWCRPRGYANAARGSFDDRINPVTRIVNDPAEVIQLLTSGQRVYAQTFHEESLKDAAFQVWMMDSQVPTLSHSLADLNYVDVEDMDEAQEAPFFMVSS